MQSMKSFLPSCLNSMLISDEHLRKAMGCFPKELVAQSPYLRKENYGKVYCVTSFPKHNWRGCRQWPSMWWILEQKDEFYWISLPGRTTRKIYHWLVLKAKAEESQWQAGSQPKIKLHRSGILSRENGPTQRDVKYWAGSRGMPCFLVALQF